MFGNARYQNKMCLDVSNLVRAAPLPLGGLSGLTTLAVCHSLPADSLVF